MDNMSEVNDQHGQQLMQSWEQNQLIRTVCHVIKRKLCITIIPAAKPMFCDMLP